MRILIAGVLLIILLAACSPAIPSADLIQTAIAQTQAAITPSATPAPTFTPTVTSSPTLTLTPTLIPTADLQAAAQAVIAAFKNAGLEAENPSHVEAKDYGLAPYVCYGERFLIPSLGADSGGRVFICNDPADQAALADFYNSLAKSSAIFFSWVFTKGNVLVQINGELPEATARQYEAAIP